MIDDFIAIMVRIRRTVDGVERDVEYRYHTSDISTETVRWQWCEGNYACDCNRAALFARAGGEASSSGVCGSGEYVIVAPDWLRETTL